jgi:starch phosphorylase
MVRHTLKSLGPKVLATRMVRDYVRQLYTPAAVTGRQLNSDYSGAAALAEWKKRVRAGWSGVRVEHVESSGVGDSPEIGAELTVRAFVSLGELDPADVDVQLVHGVINSEDELVASSVESLSPVESYQGGRHRFDGGVRLGRSGAFGYTVRVVPRNDLLASPAELGVVALPA